MANTLTASIDLSGAAPVLTVVGNYSRAVSVTVTDRGVTATAKGIFPLTVADASGHVWTKRTDDGTTAVFDY